jgi:hypothetical protein
LYAGITSTTLPGFTVRRSDCGSAAAGTGGWSVRLGGIVDGIFSVCARGVKNERGALCRGSARL